MNNHYSTQQLGYTHHAHKRASQRGFTPLQVATILRYGRKSHHAGAIYYSIGRKEIARFANDTTLLKEMNGMHVVTSTTGIILTMFRNRNFRILNHR